MAQLNMRRKHRWAPLTALFAVLAAVVLAASAGVGLAKYAFTLSPDDVARAVAPEGDYVRVYVDEGESAPYRDSVWGPYYIAYVGSSRAVVDVADDLDAAGELLDTKVTTTYRMFEGMGAEVERVLLPDVGGLATFDEETGSLGAAPAIDPRTFGDAGPSRQLDVVYRDATGADHTGDLASAPHAERATCYLYLDDAVLGGAGAASPYAGDAPNVYVSEDVSSLAGLLAGNASVARVLFCDAAPAAWANLTEVFKGCSGLVSVANASSVFSQAQTVQGAFDGCASLPSVPEGFAFPAGADDLSRVLAGCSSIASLPEGLAVPASATTAAELFEGCSALASLPKGFLNGASALVNMERTFKGCARLQAELLIPRQVSSLSGIFDGAGVDAEPCFDALGGRAETGAVHAVVGWYYDDHTAAAAEAGTLGSDGRAVMLPMVWEKVYSSDGPYDAGDGLGSYYIRYIGSDDTVDVAAHMGSSGEILGTKITTTYRMFDPVRPALKTILLPDVAGLRAYDPASGALGADPAIDPAVFGVGGAPDHFVELVYRDASGGDHTADAATTNSTIYLYLDTSLVPPDADGDCNYAGTVPNVYLSNDLPSIRYAVYNNSSIIDVAIDRSPNAGWTDMEGMFAYSSVAGLSSYFEVPLTVTSAFGVCLHAERLKSLPEGFVFSDALTSMPQAFEACTSLETLPSGFTFPKQCEMAKGMFRYCSSLKGLPDGFTLKGSSVANACFMFQGCGQMQGLPDGFGLPLSLTGSYSSSEGYRSQFMFDGCRSITSVPSGFFEEAPYLTELGAMFRNCTGLTTLPDDFLLPPATQNCSSMFLGCSGLTMVPSGFFSQVTGQFNALSVFKDCTMLSCDLTLPAQVYKVDSLFENAGSGAPKRYDAAGVDVGEGNGSFSIVMRYDPASTVCANYDPANAAVTKVPIAANALTAQEEPLLTDALPEAESLAATPSIPAPSEEQAQKIPASDVTDASDAVCEGEQVSGEQAPGAAEETPPSTTEEGREADVGLAAGAAAGTAAVLSLVAPAIIARSGRASCEEMRRVRRLRGTADRGGRR